MSEDHKKDLFKAEELDGLMESMYGQKIGYGRKAKKKRKNLEGDFVIQCTQAFDLQFRNYQSLFFVIKNEQKGKLVKTKTGKTINITGAYDKKKGIKKGVADKLLSVPKHGYMGFYCEFKWDSTWSQDQKNFCREVTAQGYLYKVFRKDVQVFLDSMRWYLNGSGEMPDVLKLCKGSGNY